MQWRSHELIQDAYCKLLVALLRLVSSCISSGEIYDLIGENAGYVSWKLGPSSHWLPTFCAGRPRLGRRIVWRQTCG